ncbi:unnamed protein product [Victoria cruziana]
MGKFQFCGLLLPILITMLLAGALPSSAGTCDPKQLSACLGAIQGSGPPSGPCCSALNAQKSCFCKYAKDPSLKGMIMSPASKKIASYCKVPFPSKC